MAQYQIPQFIETENKIVGPLTLREFMYLAAAGAASFLLFFIGVNLYLWFLITFILGIVSVALAFIKYNSQPLPKVLWLAAGFLWKPRLYLWQREVIQRVIEIPTLPSLQVPREAVRARTNWRETLAAMPRAMPSVDKLWQDLTTTKEPIPKRERVPRTPYWGKKPQERFEIFRKLTGEKEMARRIDYR